MQSKDRVFAAEDSPIFVFDKIIKRDGRIVPFDSTKITTAILKAGRATGEFGDVEAKRLTIRVLTLAQAVFADVMPSVEEIQDLVEEVLLASPFKKTAKAYILYRDQHARIRQMVQKADIDLIENYLERLDWKVRENSNMAYSLQGLNNYVSSEVTKTYWLNKIYTPEVREAHLRGDIHIHDLGLLSVYCVGWDLQDLLMSGFRGAPGKAESSPARHFRSALGQIVNFFYTLQGEAAGAQAFSNFDTLLAPFIRYDKLTYREVKQALQEFVFNLNVPTRVGFQTPFTNLTMDLEPPKTLKDQRVVIGGEFKPETYGEFQEEMNMLNQAFLEVMSEGDARGRVFTFPIPTYNITPDFDWENPGLSRLWEVTARYGIPYFANFVTSDMSPDDARSMCCRLRLDVRALEKKGGGLFGANPLTGSIGVVTINMAAIGYRSNSEAEFLEQLERMMEISRTSLECKRKVLERFSEQGLYPYTKFYLRHIKERHGNYWSNHFSTIGLIGMNEACLNMFGKDLSDPEAVAFAARVLDFMKDVLVRFQEETGNLYNLEATPGEGTAYRLAKLDTKRFPGIKIANMEKTDTPFYTNSTHLPVDFTDDIIQVLDLQEPLQSRYTGGTVLHVFLGEAAPDPQAVKDFVRMVCENYSLPYFTITPSFSICPSHGYLEGEQLQCPKCGASTEIYSRVVGYLRPVNQWNDGKQAEFTIRSRFSV
ncbi:Ribonucleotide reductase of class III (anaerobic), large subunit [Dissulfuribacter thermophilus]|uniref:Ribonucleotide reductase of class III (Anaerobic), large subunit n=1 Tax=Dissulfuribacter thermophilus TaxID=1156395 RepID=A0A1B9F453_9BACT|nr:ribonucleoside triphosphate reductase [Dissulfuribacter thermophilus]OCC14729.1 Ribonucleotide reductase of class III (anaerobic), large subunit [Dissulfuribacter thermophilus]